MGNKRRNQQRLRRLRWFWVDVMDYYNDPFFPRPVTRWQKVKLFAYAVECTVKDWFRI